MKKETIFVIMAAILALSVVAFFEIEGFLNGNVIIGDAVYAPNHRIFGTLGTKPSDFCKLLDPYDRKVALTALSSLSPRSDIPSIDSLIDVYDYIKENIRYSIDNVDIIVPPAKTIDMKKGDCKHQSVLGASLLASLGHEVRLALLPGCNHAYVIVHMTDDADEMDSITKEIMQRYGVTAEQVQWAQIKDELWLIFDTAAGDFPGDTRESCIFAESFPIESCVEPHI